jgi:hypothetical protein
MFFLLRVAFWLSIVVLLLPAPEKSADPARPQVSTFEAIGAAQTAIADMREFCTRKPEACETGSHALNAFGQKAQYGAKLLYDFLSERFADDKATPRAADTPTGQPGRHTLNPGDLTPTWSLPEKAPLPPRRPA